MNPTTCHACAYLGPRDRPEPQHPADSCVWCGIKLGLQPGIYVITPAAPGTFPELEEQLRMIRAADEAGLLTDDEYGEAMRTAIALYS